MQRIHRSRIHLDVDLFALESSIFGVLPREHAQKGETALEARYLEIELTESAVMHDAEQFVAMLNELNDLGVQIAIDDFGTGYSSLSYLKRFPVDRLKVDRSFVQDIATDSDDATIVRTIIALGHNLGLKVVAEGVETEQQLQFLRENNCDELQGYLYGMPLAADELACRVLAQGAVMR